MRHHDLLTYCCQQAEQDLRTGYGIGYSGDPVEVQIQAFPVVDDPGAYQVCAKANNQVGVLCHPGDDFLEGLLAKPERVEGYVSILRTNAWKWTHSEDARSLVLVTNKDPK